MPQSTCVDLELLNFKHRNRNSDLVQEYYSYKDRKYSGYLQIFTDGSKDPLTETTGAAIVIPSHQTGFSGRTADYFVRVRLSYLQLY